MAQDWFDQHAPKQNAAPAPPAAGGGDWFTAHAPNAAATPPAPPAPLKPLEPLDYHPAGTEGSPAGSFADTVLRPVGNAGRAFVRGAIALPGSVAQSVRESVANLPQDARDLMHPLDAHRRAAEAMLQHGQEGQRFDPNAPINYDRDVPELAGNAALQFALMEAAGRAVPAVVERTPASLRRAAQKIVGLGDKPVIAEVKKTVERAGVDAERVRASNKDATERTEKARGAVDENNAATLKKAVAERLEKIKHDQDALRAHHQAVDETKAGNERTRVAHRKRETAQAELDKTASELTEAHNDAKANAERADNAAWQPVHEGTAGETEDITPLREVAKTVAQDADPVTLPIVRSLLREGTVTFDEGGRPVIDGKPRPVMVNGGSGAKEIGLEDPNYSKFYEMQYSELPPIAQEGGTATFARLHRLYSYIGSKLYGGARLETGTYKALSTLQFNVDQAMGRIAERTGQTENLAKARKLHTERMQAFSDSPNQQHTVSSKSRQETIPEHVKAEAEAERLRKVARFNPQVTALSERAQRLQEALDALPKPIPARKQVAPLPERPGSAPLPLPGSSTRLPAAKPPELQQYKEPYPNAPIVRPEVGFEQTREAMLDTLSKKFGITGYDGGILASSLLAHPMMKLFGGAGEALRVGAVGYVAGKGAIRAWLESPAVREWLAHTPPEEVRVMSSKIPNIERVKIVDALTSTAVTSAKAGHPLQVSLAAAKFIGPDNMALIAAANSLNHYPRTAGEAKARVAELRAQ